ncbi:hypothetical protein [Parasphingopyxis sp.]|uniref:hypothetical protein n=1 Tax=Parasphingopyxis sp. TaxID=1920299 RepID=UPI0026204672|nr:hypothetical protein [Parasphingopyxis sp.]
MNELSRQLTANVHKLDGALNFNLEVFGDHIAEREGYQRHQGLEALRFYIIEKFKWLPRDVRTMSLDDMRFILEEEMHGWTLPEDAKEAYKIDDLNPMVGE